MSDFRDSLKGGASFRGVPFKIDSSEFSGGRRVVIHEFPFRDVPYVEDLGRKGRLFDVEAYVIGDDYLDQKQNLIDAIEQGGPGTLIHPYYGTLLVSASTIAVRESRDENGWAKISISFHETDPRTVTPTQARAPLGQVNASADAVLSSTGDAYARKMMLAVPQVGTGALTLSRPKSLPTFAFTSVSQLVSSYNAALLSAMAPVAASTDAMASTKSQLDSITLGINSLIRTPLVLAARLKDVAASLLELPQTPRLGVSALLTAYGFASSSARPVATTPTRTAEQTNYDATDAMLRIFTIAQAVRFAAESATLAKNGAVGADGGYDSYEDAIGVRDALTVAIDAQAQAVNDDDAYSSLMQLRADLVAAVPGEQSTLPHIVAVTPTITFPSLVLAYRLYGDVDLEQDLISRNRVRHPGFVIGGTALQVLSRG